MDNAQKEPNAWQFRRYPPLTNPRHAPRRLSDHVLLVLRSGEQCQGLLTHLAPQYMTVETPDGERLVYMALIAEIHWY